MSLVSNPQISKPAWANLPIRLDPAQVDRKQSFERVEDGETVSYRVDRRGAVIRRKLEQSGIPVAVAVAASAFQGVAARAMEDDEGNVTVTLELLHPNARLSVPLLVAADLYDVAADWRSWSETFGLPMLMVESSGQVTALDDPASSVIRDGRPAAARRNAPHRARRPRFLARRKPGGLGLRMVIAGDEIIARN